MTIYKTTPTCYCYLFQRKIHFAQVLNIWIILYNIYRIFTFPTPQNNNMSLY